MKFFALMLLILSSLISSAHAALTLWRTTVAPGGQTLAWSHSGTFPAGKGGASIPNAWELSDGTRTISLGRELEGTCVTWDDAAYATTLYIPDSTPPGSYSLLMLGKDTGKKITVTPKLIQRTVFLSPKGHREDDTAAIQGALAENTALVLEPGVYQIGSTINLPVGASISGESRDAVILRRNHNSADYQDTVFTSTEQGGAVGITDLTLDASGAIGAFIFHSDIENRNFEVARVKLILARGPLGRVPGELVEDVDFVDSTVMTSGPGLFRRVHFQGVSHVSNAIIVLGSEFAMIDCSWQDTDRGIVLRRGPTNDYFQSLTFDGITHIPNGNEGILHEDLEGSGPMADCIFSHITFRTCHGSAFQFSIGAHDNLIQHLDVDGGGGIAFMQTSEPQTANTFRDCELRNCAGINLGQAKGNILEGIAIIHPVAGWVNQTNFNPQWYPSRTAAIRGASGNMVKNVIVRDLPFGWYSGLEDYPPR